MTRMSNAAVLTVTAGLMLMAVPAAQGLVAPEYRPGNVAHYEVSDALAAVSLVQVKSVITSAGGGRRTTIDGLHDQRNKWFRGEVRSKGERLRVWATRSRTLSQRPGRGCWTAIQRLHYGDLTVAPFVNPSELTDPVPGADAAYTFADGEITWTVTSRDKTTTVTERFSTATKLPASQEITQVERRAGEPERTTKTRTTYDYDVLATTAPWPKPRICRKRV